MAKKKSRVSLVFNVFIILLVLGAVAMIFLPAFRYEGVVAGIGATDYTGWDITIGKNFDTGIGFLVTAFNLSPVNLVAYCLAILVVILTIICLALKKNNKFLAVLTMLIAVAVGCLFIFAKHFVVLGDLWNGVYGLAGKTFASDEAVKMGIGTIISASLMFVSALFSGVKLFLKR